MTKHRHLFTDRQLVALCNFSDLVVEVRQRVVAAGASEKYADAAATYLALVFDRVIDRHSSITTWDASPSKLQVRGFSPAKPSRCLGISPKQTSSVDRPAPSSPALPGSHVSWNGSEAGRQALDSLMQPPSPPERPVLFATDPPYYDNIGYADLSTSSTCGYAGH